MLAKLISKNFPTVDFVNSSAQTSLDNDKIMNVSISILGDSLGYTLVLYPAHYQLDYVSIDNASGRRLTAITNTEEKAFIDVIHFANNLTDIFNHQTLVDGMLFYADELRLPLLSESQFAVLKAPVFSELVSGATICNISYPAK